MRKKLLMNTVMLCLTMIISSSYAQMNYWGIIPTKIDFTGGSPTASAISGAPSAPLVGPNQSYNAMWDENGDLLFYIADAVIYRPNGTGAGNVSIPVTTSPSRTYVPRGDGYHIIPVPGSVTKKYFIIHAAFNGFAGIGLVYTTVECTTPGSVTVTNPVNTLVYTSSAGGNYAGIAITKPRTDNSRILYLLTTGDNAGQTKDIIKKFDITSTGIAFNTNIYAANLNTITHETTDAEIYEDQDGYLLAWGSQNYDRFNCIKLNTSGAYTGTSYAYSLAAGYRPIGIEFSADGKSIYATVGANNILLPNKGVYKTSITGSPSLISSSANYSDSQIELGKDGLLYVVNKTNGALSTLDPATNTFAASATGVNMAGGYQFSSTPGYAYLLPKQQNDENYTCIHTQLSIPYSTTINTDAVTTNCASTPYTYNSCAAIQFNTSHSVAPAFYQFDIQSMDGSCNVNAASGTIHYNSGWVSGAPSANYNIGTLTDGSGINLNTIAPGKVRVIYSVKNSCGAVRSITTYFNVTNPGPGLSNFTLNGSGTATSCGSPLNLYSCVTSSLLMTPAVLNSGSVVSHELTIKAVDASCNILSGPGLIDYSSGTVSGNLASNTELINLAGGNLVSLNGYSGYVLITYSVTDACSSINSVSHVIRMNSAPTVGTTSMTLNSYTSPGVPVAAVATVPSVRLGMITGSLNLSTASVMESYSVTVDEVNCGTGTTVLNICTDVPVTLASPATYVPGINLNALYVPSIPARSWTAGYGYFISKGFNTCYRVYISPENDCGSTTVSSYITFDAFPRLGTSSGIVTETGETSFYPTSFDGEVTVNYLLQGSSNQVSLRVYDLSGRLIATLIDEVMQGSGTQQLNANTSSIAPGSYIFVLEANGSKYSQLMNKK